jgi:chromatin segregation and condensation protein Rec8/ScpA/Scc1 (kleisin family)
MRLVIDAFLFLELSGDEVVDPDAAVQQMESIMAELRDMPKADREVFARFVEQMLAEEEKRGGEPQQIKALRAILVGL